MKKRDLSLLVSYFMLAMCLLFTSYSLVLSLIPSTLDLFHLNGKEERNSFYSYIPSRVSLEMEEGNRAMMVSLNPGREDQWVGWNLEIQQKIPEWAELWISLDQMEHLQVININLIERDSSFPSQQREYWFHTLTVQQEEPQFDKIPLNQFTHNTGFQFNPDGVNEILELEQGFILEMNIPPQLHHSTVRYRIQRLELRWKNRTLPLILAGLLWTAIVLRIIGRFRKEIHQGSEKGSRNFYHRALLGSALILLISSRQFFQGFIPPPWVWVLPLVYAAVLSGYQLWTSSLWNYHFFLYPAILFLMQIDPYLLPFFLLLIYFPFLYSSLPYKVIPLILYPLTLFLMTLSGGLDFPIISYFMILLPLGLDIIWTLFLRDRELQEERDISTQLLNAVMTNTDESILIAEGEGTIVSYNRGFQLWLGLVESENISGKKIEEILPREFDPQWFKHKGEFSREIELKRGEQEKQYMIRTYQVKQRDNLIMQWYITDISETYRLRKELEKANRELEILAVSDELTGLNNRRYFNRVMEKEWNRCIRTGTPMTLVLSDVDFFKSFNDLYGHQEGDEALKLVGEIWKTGARRSYDVAARIGGEEFVLMLPDTEAESVRTVLDEIQQALVKINIPHENSEVSKRLTLSIGVCSVIPRQDMPWKILMEEVDKSLYKAKREGRNRIIYCSNWD